METHVRMWCWVRYGGGAVQVIRLRAKVREKDGLIPLGVTSHIMAPFLPVGRTGGDAGWDGKIEHSVWNLLGGRHPSGQDRQAFV